MFKMMNMKMFNLSKNKLTEIEVALRALRYLGIIEKQQEKINNYENKIKELQKENETLRGMMSDYITQVSKMKKELSRKESEIPKSWKKQTLDSEFRTIFA